MQTIRFWHFGPRGSPVLIKLRKDQTLAHEDGGWTDEGWFRSVNRWSFDGWRVTNEWVEDGEDCDGRMMREGVSYFYHGEQRAGYVDESDEAGVQWPAWKQGRSTQRDYSAEAAGY